MFYWGSYSFQLPQQQEHPDRPPLKYPVYLPPTPAYCAQQQQRARQQQPQPHAHLPGGNAAFAGEEEESRLLDELLHTRLQVKQIACGLKHAVIVIQEPPGPSCPHPRTALYGLGSNHSGQLGHRVATYTSTLVNLTGGSHDTGLGSESADGSSGDTGIVSIACGLRHTLVATNKGVVYVCGDNSMGQLGLSSASLTSYARRGRGAAGAADDTDGGGARQHQESSVAQLTQVTSLAHITRVFASHHSSFAIDGRGAVYSWGEATYGHLGHGGDHIVADEKGGLDRVENVRQPRTIRWFERHRIAIGDAAVGRGHVLFASKDGEDVYTCGEGHFGKLGHGDVNSSYEPRRLESFPERKQRERVVSIAAGDDCSLVLKANPVMGSVVYFFGKLSNGDGQLKPIVVPFPYLNLVKPVTTMQSAGTHADASAVAVGTHSLALASVSCGRGNQCLALSADGRLYVWGKSSYARLANGTDADAPRTRPCVVRALEKFVLSGAVAGGTLMMAWGNRLRDAGEAAPTARSDHTSIEEEEADNHSDEDATGAVVKATLETADGHAWDVVVPHDARLRGNIAAAASRGGAIGDSEEVYEHGVRAMLRGYFGPVHARLAERYISGIPAAPPLTKRTMYRFPHVAVQDLQVGQKVRLWMTDLYALGTIVKLDAEDKDDLAAQSESAAAMVVARAASPSRISRTPSRAPSQASQPASPRPHGGTLKPTLSPAAAVAAAAASQQVGNVAQQEEDAGNRPGRRCLIAWERDDWRDEVVTLYSEDEILDEDNENRWQPFWFEQDPEGGGYRLAKSR